MSVQSETENQHSVFSMQSENEPVFREPWEAQAFALVLRLHEQGYFSWTEWADALSREIAATDTCDGTENYYQFWLQALESLIIEKNLATTIDLDSRQLAWEQAHKNTPHGEPVDLANAVKQQIAHGHRSDTHDH